MENLIIILCAVHNRSSGSLIRSTIIPLGNASELNREALSNAKSVSAVADRLHDSSHGRFYPKVLQNAMHEYDQEKAIYILEIALYLFYYRTLYKNRHPFMEGRDEKPTVLLVF